MASNEFTWNEIEEDWLAHSELALSDDEVVTAFNKVCEFFGREWVESSRIRDGVVVRGTSTTLDIVTLGKFLAVLGDAPNAEHLLAKIRNRKNDAWAELAAIYLLRFGQSEVELALEPTVIVGGDEGKVDSAVRRPDDGDWTYVEVKQANPSEAQAEVMAEIHGLVKLASRYLPRRIARRFPITDTRGAKFARKAAEQLPTYAPGLIMIQTGTLNAMRTWRSLIENIFQQKKHTRVSAVCLFSGAQRRTPEGAIWEAQTKLVINPHARLALPTWISEQLRHFPSDEADL
jgi:hypothetical protein